MKVAPIAALVTVTVTSSLWVMLQNSQRSTCVIMFSGSEQILTFAFNCLKQSLQKTLEKRFEVC